jgi:HEAT repeat protein
VFAIGGIEYYLRVNEERDKSAPLTAPEASDLRNLLVGALKDPGDAGEWGGNVAGEAILTMVRHKLLTKEAVPGLRHVLRGHKSIATRGFAAQALGTLRGAAVDAVPDLIRAVEMVTLQTDRQAYCSFIRALGEIGEPARTARPALSKAAESQDNEISSIARDVLRMLTK